MIWSIAAGISSVDTVRTRIESTFERRSSRGVSIDCIGERDGNESGPSARVAPPSRAERIAEIRPRSVPGSVRRARGGADAELDRRPGRDEQVVLILADDVGPLAAEDADDPQRHVVDVDLLADRRLLVEQLARERLAEQADHGDVVDVALGERLAFVQVFPLPDAKVSRGGADEGARDPVLVPVDDLPAREDQGCQAVDARAFVEDRLGVLGRQGLDAAAAEADAIARRRAGLDHDVIDTRLGQECANRRPCPLADLGDGDAAIRRR